MKLRVSRWLPLALLLLAGAAAAQTAGPPAPASGAAAAPAPALPAAGDSISGICIERVPEGKAPPKLVESFPSRGKSGHAATLTVKVTHLKGEEVLPGGFRIAEGEGLEALKRAHLTLPDPEGPAGPVITRSAEGTETELKLSLVPLPPEPGRHELTLPPLPISVARASGQVVTVCTKSHSITVEDPIANTPDPMPKPNPPPRRQLEEWEILKRLVYGGLVALIAGVIAAWLFTRWRKRPRAAPLPPPPRPAWEVALEELHDIRHAGLIRQQRFSEHYDRVSDAIRQYLGDRFGFDGLESTTREALSVLEKVTPPIESMDKVQAFLRQADLVKFARLTPTEDECELALSRGEDIVRSTMPTSGPAELRGVTARGAA
ncbi:MAG TPA: hypothetical protein VI197_02005 [Polyangiaceae bacterium]